MASEFHSRLRDEAVVYFNVTAQLITYTVFLLSQFTFKTGYHLSEQAFGVSEDCCSSKI